MPATASVSPTGDNRIDGLLSGIRWGVDTLTFSFPTSGSFYGTYSGGEHLTKFEAFTPLQQQAIRTILDSYSDVANLNFVEVTESSTVHGDLRYAESDKPSTAWAYYPSTSAAGGDAWFNNSKNWYDNPAKGNYAWLTMIHETGHALGLKHPHQASGSFGALPTQYDSLEYSVMSYRSYIGASTTSGYTNGSTSYPQTLMMLDIAALQEMYGANYTTNAGDTVYRWNAATGEMSINGTGQGAPAGNKIFMTVWDGGGNDTYDFSGYSTGVNVDLNPGGWTTTSATQLASLGNGRVAVGNIANALLYENNPASLIENVVGGTGNDRIIGNSADNTIAGGRGSDYIDGGAGQDTAAYTGLTSDYLRVENSDGTWTITDLRTNGDGIDTLNNIEHLRFSDGVIALGDQTVPDEPTPEEPIVENAAPVTYADSYTTGKGKKLVVTAANGVLKNDVDADGDPLSAILVTGPARGALSLQADGSFVYTPPRNFTGTVSFTYRADDGETDSATTTVTVVVGGTTARARRGANANDHHVEDDQIPAPVSLADEHSDWLPFLVATAKDADFAASSPGAHPHIALLGELIKSIEGLGAGQKYLGLHDFDDHGLGASGLPDYMAAAYSEFHLA